MHHFTFREFSREPVQLDIANVTAGISALSAEKNTTIIVHGHEGSATTSLNPIVKDGRYRLLHIKTPL